MGNDCYYCVIMTDNSEIKGAAAELLAAFDYNISSWKDEESQIVKHTIYFTSDEEGRAGLEFLKQESSKWKEFGIDLSDFQYTIIQKEDWAESWKLHFKTMVLSPRLVIKPSWEKYTPLPGQQVIILDPGMSFGTGQHATTKSCLLAIDEFTCEARAQGRTLSFLDAGSGSGILSIAAVKLGCSPVRAFDIDPDTIQIARENARTNGIRDEELDLQTSSLEDYDNKDFLFDLIAANILSSALISGRRKLLSMVKPGGKLILAGILATEYEQVKDSFEELGCKEIKSVQEKEWRGGSFLVPRKN